MWNGLYTFVGGLRPFVLINGISSNTLHLVILENCRSTPDYCHVETKRPCTLTSIGLLESEESCKYGMIASALKTLVLELRESFSGSEECSLVGG